MNTDKLNIPAAIIVAGLIVAIAIYAGGSKMPAAAEKSVAARAGLNETKLQACAAADTYKDKILAQAEGGDRAMAILPPEKRGTPYNVMVNVKTGVKVQLAGAYPYEAFKAAIDGLIDGTAQGEAINLDPITDADHWYGNKDAEIVLVEYGDLECPYCALAHPTIQKIMTDYDGKVAWVFRHFPLNIHPNAHIKANAVECAGAQGGDAAFFRYLNANYEQILEEQQPKFDTTTL